MYNYMYILYIYKLLLQSNIFFLYFFLTVLSAFSTISDFKKSLLDFLSYKVVFIIFFGGLLTTLFIYFCLLLVELPRFNFVFSKGISVDDVFLIIFRNVPSPLSFLSNLSALVSGLTNPVGTIFAIFFSVLLITLKMIITKLFFLLAFPLLIPAL